MLISSSGQLLSDELGFNACSKTAGVEWGLTQLRHMIKQSGRVQFRPVTRDQCCKVGTGFQCLLAQSFRGGLCVGSGQVFGQSE